jgi:hypothetical protein
VRRLRRKVRAQDKALALQKELQTLLWQLERPPLLAPLPDLPTPVTDLIVAELEDLPPPLTQAEIEEIRALPMPDPLEEIEHRLGLSTSPPSPQTWAG